MSVKYGNGLRWTVARKAALIEDIRGGVITREKAQKDFLLSSEELAEWTRDYDKHGESGLRTTKIYVYQNRPRQGRKPIAA